MKRIGEAAKLLTEEQMEALREEFPLSVEVRLVADVKDVRVTPRLPTHCTQCREELGACVVVYGVSPEPSHAVCLDRPACRERRTTAEDKARTEDELLARSVKV